MLAPINWKAPNAGELMVSDLRETGFCVLRNHPVDLAGLDALRGAWRSWFKDCKAKASYRRDYTHAGWFGRADAEQAVGRDRRDDKEYFHVFWNSLPQVPSNLKGITREHFMEMREFAEAVACAIEVHTPMEEVPYYMGLREAIEDSQNTLLRILYYPAMRDGELDWLNERGIEDCRAAAHTDVNLFTMIPCNAEPGLQLKDQIHGEWKYVPWHPTYLVINVGDMLELMSGGFYTSVEHRVVTPHYPSGGGIPTSRMSLPFFVHPRPEVKISHDYTAGEYLAERLRELDVA